MKERMHFIGAEFQTGNLTAELLVKSGINTAVNTDPLNIEHRQCRSAVQGRGIGNIKHV